MKKILYIGNYLKRDRNNPTYMHNLGSLLETEGYKVRFSSSKNNKVLRLLDMLWSVLKHNKWADVVLIDTYSTQNFYYAFAVSQLCRTFSLKYICILHGGNLPSRLKSNPVIASLIFKNSKFNISPSNYLKSEFENHDYNNIEFIPNTIAIEDYAFTNRSFDKIRLLWVRSFSKIYNPALAIRVQSELRARGHMAELCMVGPDSDGTLKDVKDLAEKLNVQVNITGKLSKHQWIALSKDYNIFINTTNLDNTPVSVIEAMALGLPVVSTDVGGMPFLIENEIQGLLVPPDNSKEMTDALIKIMTDDILRNRIIKNARFRAELFNWEEIKHDWKRILAN